MSRALFDHAFHEPQQFIDAERISNVSFWKTITNFLIGILFVYLVSTCVFISVLTHEFAAALSVQLDSLF